MNKSEFVEEVYTSDLEKGGTFIVEDEELCENRIVLLLESIAFSLHTIAEKLNGVENGKC